ncbi:MAG TPA: hypothetical protein VFH55_02085 [Nitrospiria bacterium]|nr:hypothetical protein [Nitrospiria bacterium]
MDRKNLMVILAAFFLIVGISVSVWAEKQPHMKSALEGLRQAKAQLEKAEPDKGGHRVEAIKLIDQAIQEVKAGIEYDNEHKDHKDR